MTQERSDNDLIKLALEGDQSAFEELYRRYEKRIFNFAYGMVGNVHAAGDVTHDTFLLVYKNLYRYRPGKSAASWIYKIAKNVARNHFRTRRRGEERYVSIEKKTSDDESSLADYLQTKDKNPEETLRIKEFHGELQRAINSLPEKYREVLLLHDVEGLSYEEVGQVLRRPYKTITSQLAKAHLLLQKRIDPNKIDIQFFFNVPKRRSYLLSAMKTKFISGSQLIEYVDGKMSNDKMERFKKLMEEVPDLRNAILAMEKSRILLKHKPFVYPQAGLSEHVLSSIHVESPPDTPWFAPFVNGFDMTADFIFTAPRILVWMLILGLTILPSMVKVVQIEERRSLRVVETEKERKIKPGELITTKKSEMILNRPELFTMKLEENTEAIVKQMSHVGGIGRNEIILQNGTILFKTEKHLSRGDFAVLTPWFTAVNRGTVAAIERTKDSARLVVWKGALLISFSDSAQKPLIIRALQELVFNPHEPISAFQPISQEWLEKLSEFSSDRLVVLALPPKNPAAALVAKDQISVAFGFMNIPENSRREKMKEARRLFENTSDADSMKKARLILDQLAVQYELEGYLNVSAPLFLFEAAISSYLQDDQTALFVLEKIGQDSRYERNVQALASVAMGIIYERQEKKDLARKAYESAANHFPDTTSAEEAKERLSQLQ